MLGFENSSLPSMSILWSGILFPLLPRQESEKDIRKMNSTKIVKEHSSYVLDILQFSFRKIWGKPNKLYLPRSSQMFSWQVYTVGISITSLHREILTFREVKSHAPKEKLGRRDKVDIPMQICLKPKPNQTLSITTKTLTFIWLFFSVKLHKIVTSKMEFNIIASNTSGS